MHSYRSFPSQEQAFTDIQQAMSDSGEHPYHFTDIRQAVSDKNSKKQESRAKIVYMSRHDSRADKLKKLGPILTIALNCFCGP